MRKRRNWWALQVFYNRERPSYVIFNPCTPKGAIWHKMPFYVQYLVNLIDIWTEKWSQTDLSLSNIRSCPSPTQTWLATPTTFATFSGFTLKVKSISKNNHHIKGCTLSYSLGVYPRDRRKEVFFVNFFFISHAFKLNSNYIYVC